MAEFWFLTGTTAKPRETFQPGGVPTDLDTGVPTVTLYRPDDSVHSTPTATHVGATGSGTYEFSLASQNDPIQLRAKWVGTIGGLQQTLTTRIEIIGGSSPVFDGDFLYNLADLRAVKVGNGLPFQSTTDYPDSQVLAKRIEVTRDFERRCGWSFIPRYTREIKDGTGCGELMLDRRSNGAQRLLTVTINGITQNTANYTLDRSGMLYATTNYQPTGWFQPGVSNVVVEYVHGWTRPPPTLSSAGMARTAMLLLPNQVGSTVSSWTTPDGTTYSYDQAGQFYQGGGGKRHYGVPGIDSVLNEYTPVGMLA